MAQSRTLKWDPDGEVLPPSRQTDLTSFRGEWPVLLECASPAFDVRRFLASDEGRIERGHGRPDSLSGVVSGGGPRPSIVAPSYMYTHGYGE
jgi:hypothetical protein